MGLFKIDKKIKIFGIEFEEFDMDNRAEFEKYLFSTSFPINCWKMNFTYTCMFSESAVRKVLYKIIDDMYCLFVYQNSGLLIMPYFPLGVCDEKKFNAVLLKCFKIMYVCNEKDASKCIVRTAIEPQLYMLNEEYFKPAKTGFGFEHTYDVKKVVGMQGKDQLS